MKKIICTHLFNDYSGSPLVLSNIIQSLRAANLEVEVITSGGTKGFLSDIQGVKYRFLTYRFFENKILRLLMFCWAQCVMFLKTLKYWQEDVVIYVNTLQPFGAALAGRLLGKKVIYHLHETTVNPPLLKKTMKKVAAACASEAIYVSHFLQKQEMMDNVPYRVVHNCLSASFLEKADDYRSQPPQQPRRFTCLMLCSLKAYKGVNEFVALAGMLPQYRFVLVINSSEDAVRAFFKDMPLPDNIVIFPVQKEVHSFYENAQLVLNLSHPEKWVETFGMTLLEGMSYGLPAIAPTVGGPTELIEDGLNGYKLDQRNLGLIAEKIRDMAENKHTYETLSANALSVALRFNEHTFASQILETILGPTALLTSNQPQ